VYVRTFDYSTAVLFVVSVVVEIYAVLGFVVVDTTTADAVLVDTATTVLVLDVVLELTQIFNGLPQSKPLFQIDEL